MPSASTSTLRSSNRLSTITGGSSSASRTSSTTRGRKSASHGGSARTSKRTLLRPSFEVLVPTVTYVHSLSETLPFTYRLLSRSVNGRTRMRSQKSSGQSSRQRSAPTSPPFVLTGTSGLGSFISLVEIFTRAGLTPLPLTRAEVIRSEETPGRTWRDVCGVLGGNWRAEWVECQKIPGYKKFLCADHRAQPYLPTGTGQPGLIFCPPTITPENDNVAFQVLSYSPQDNLLYYQGEYTKVPLSRIQVSFCDLPAPVSFQKHVHVQRGLLSLMSCSAGNFGQSASVVGGNILMLLSLPVSNCEINSTKSLQLPRSRNTYDVQQRRQLRARLLLHFELVKRSVKHVLTHIE